MKQATESNEGKVEESYINIQNKLKTFFTLKYRALQNKSELRIKTLEKRVLADQQLDTDLKECRKRELILQD